MSHPIRRPRGRHATWTLVSLALLILAALLSAQYGDSLVAESGSGDEQPLTPIMQAFLADQMPAEKRPAMGTTPCIGGMAGPYPCSNVDLLAFIPLADFSAGAGNDSWGWTDPLDGKEYALMGLNNGTAFVDISDPVNPVYLGKLPTHTSNSSWRDIKVYANHAFVVSEAGGHGMQVFDLTQLRTVPNPPVTFSATAHYPGFGNAHNLVINEDSGFAYGVGTSTCSGGLHMVNIQNPTNPTNAGCFSSDGYTHDAQCVNYNGPDPDHQGKEICFNFNEDTLTIVDVTNKAAPVQLSRTPYAGSGYTHQGWVTDDHVYVLLDDELDESNFGHNTRTRVFDVTNLDAVQLVGFHDGRTPAIDHNMYIHEGYVYQANYRSGLSILDISDVANANLSEVGYFDIYPLNDNPNFNGAWSTYPYYSSGVVIISGIEQGLFIVEPALTPDFRLSTNDTNLAVCGNGLDSTLLEITPRNGYTGTVNLGTDGLPAGASPSFSANPVMPPATSTLTVTVSGTPAGSYPFSVVATDPSLTSTLALQLDVYDGAPAAPTLLAPPDGATGVSTSAELSWNAAANTSSYTVEVATDAGFSNIVFSSTTAGTSATVPGLNVLTQYFWRVRASNICGTGVNSAVWSFTTGELYCNSTPISIPSSGPGSPYPSNIAVAGSSSSVVDVNVHLVGLSHTWPDDIDILVVGPQGQNLIIMSDAGGSNDLVNVDLIFDDAAASQLPDSSQITAGTYKPTNYGAGDTFPAPAPAPSSATTLSTFNGTNPNGTWSLYVVDDTGGDSGNLAGGWCLEVGTTGAVNTPPTITTAGITTPIDEDDTATLSGTFTDPDAGDTFTLTVDWGDGSAPEVFNYPAGTTSFSESHQYLDDDPTGTPSDVLDVDLLLEDDAGGSDSDTVQVTVNNVDPVVNAGADISVLLGNPAAFNGSFTDVGTLDTHTIEWDFGDGATASGSLTPTHTYTATGSYVVTLTVTDDDTGVGSDSLTVTVVDEYRIYLPVIFLDGPAAAAPIPALVNLLLLPAMISLGGLWSWWRQRCE
jgi:choice-of-anchor B domain-containing protein